jgi:Xaa-Pro dipeptidase
VPEEPFQASQTVVVQPNVVTPDRKAGVQTSQLVVITGSGLERLQQFPRGFARV